MSTLFAVACPSDEIDTTIAKEALSHIAHLAALLESPAGTAEAMTAYARLAPDAQALANQVLGVLAENKNIERASEVQALKHTAKKQRVKVTARAKKEAMLAQIEFEAAQASEQEQDEQVFNPACLSRDAALANSAHELIDHIRQLFALERTSEWFMRKCYFQAGLAAKTGEAKFGGDFLAFAAQQGIGRTALFNRMLYARVVSTMPVLMYCPSATFTFVVDHWKELSKFASERPNSPLHRMAPRSVVDFGGLLVETQAMEPAASVSSLSKLRLDTGGVVYENVMDKLTSGAASVDKPRDIIPFRVPLGFGVTRNFNPPQEAPPQHLDPGVNLPSAGQTSAV